MHKTNDHITFKVAVSCASKMLLRVWILRFSKKGNIPFHNENYILQLSVGALHQLAELQDGLKHSQSHLVQ